MYVENRTAVTETLRVGQFSGSFFMSQKQLSIIISWGRNLTLLAALVLGALLVLAHDIVGIVH